MKEQLFWEIIESSWNDTPAAATQRKEATSANNTVLFPELAKQLEHVVIPHISQRLTTLNKTDFKKFMEILNKKIRHLDRDEVHAHVGGSDDGFLDRRGFIVGMGEGYYNTVDKDPSKAARGIEVEYFAYFGYDVYEEKFGEPL
ncbi:DUF4240 domain-containing protein [Chitinophaga agrisoli]|uniref:DUF4240 domain-containing protein n=1 Tax=Chitinophaga agrisoli TaxID=2607653 RepID=A0A5B2VMX4_9BACT|nr:DUF4240 domain-containing protein [Chitinophaga agrisoli]KAA2240020.1 DUF4240 domain-containing protein [Chitinophaga agrisoli]